LRLLIPEELDLFFRRRGLVGFSAPKFSKNSSPDNVLSGIDNLTFVDRVTKVGLKAIQSINKRKTSLL
jgi:hypothetical protein